MAGGDGPPVVLKDRETGAVVQPVVIDEHTGERLDVRRLRVRPPAESRVVTDCRR